MRKFKGVRHHLQQVWEIFQTYFLYLVNLDFLLGLQLLFFGGGLMLLYFGNVPKIITLIAGLACVGFYNLSLTGVSKNLLAMARERGIGKYPIFNRDYFWLGLPVLLAYLLVSVVPLLFVVAATVAMLGGSIGFWPYILLGVVLMYLLWQWRFGLVPAIILDQKSSLWAALHRSFELTDKALWPTLGLTLLNQAILIVSVMAPIFGTFVAINWISLSAFYLYWQLKAS